MFAYSYRCPFCLKEWQSPSLITETSPYSICPSCNKETDCRKCEWKQINENNQMLCVNQHFQHEIGKDYIGRCRFFSPDNTDTNIKLQLNKPEDKI